MKKILLVLAIVSASFLMMSNQASADQYRNPYHRNGYNNNYQHNNNYRNGYNNSYRYNNYRYHNNYYGRNNYYGNNYYSRYRPYYRPYSVYRPYYPYNSYYPYYPAPVYGYPGYSYGPRPFVGFGFSFSTY